MRSSIWVLASFSLLVYFALHYDLWRGRVIGRVNWWLYVIMTGSFVNYLFWTWRWDLFSYHFRYLIVILFAVVVVWSIRRKKKDTIQKFRRYSSHVESSKRQGIEESRLQPILYLLLILFFNFSVIFSFLGYFYQPQAVQLRFPLKGGVYYVAHGGNSEAINYHHADQRQRFALDFMKLNMLGTRSWGLTPNQLTDYMIYQETIYSPCTGRVVDVVDQVKEIAPLTMNQQTKRYRDHAPTGNHVVIDCQNVRVVLAHMIPNRIRVQEQTIVKRGDPIGQVGNSGNTSEPHLHIHAEKNGKGVPILFRGRFLTRNSLFYAD